MTNRFGGSSESTNQSSGNNPIAYFRTYWKISVLKSCSKVGSWLVGILNLENHGQFHDDELHGWFEMILNLWSTYDPLGIIILMIMIYLQSFFVILESFKIIQSSLMTVIDLESHNWPEQPSVPPWYWYSLTSKIKIENSKKIRIFEKFSKFSKTQKKIFRN